VTGSPTAEDDTIDLRGWGGATATTDIGAFLTGASGGGGSGANTWDSDVTGITAIRDAILAALSDAANSWDGDWSFASSGGADIIVTRDVAGSFGNSDTLIVVSASLSGPGLLTGGVAATLTAAPLAIPSVGVTLDRLYLVTFAGGVGGFPAPVLPSGTTFLALNVGGSPDATFAPQDHNPDFNKVTVVRGSVVVPSSTALTLDLQSQFESGLGIYCLSGVLT
jgi:hypothetical protein